MLLMMSKKCGIFTAARHYLSSTQLYRSRSGAKEVDAASDEVESSEGFADAAASFTSDVVRHRSSFLPFHDAGKPKSESESENFIDF